MKTIKVLSLILIVLVCFAQLSPAQFEVKRKAGINGAAFLKVGVGAREVAMGSAVTALREEVTQMFWNPAGIALKGQTLQAVFSYDKWIAGIKHSALGVSYNLKDIGTIGLGVVAFGDNDIPADRDVYPGNPTLQAMQIDQATSSTYNYMDLAVQVSYARYVLDNLSIGATVKLINETIDDQSVSAIAFDFGSVYNILGGWTIAARLNNLGGDLKYYDYGAPIPLTFSIGTAVPVKTDVFNMLFVFDVVKPQDGLQYFYVGSEFSLPDDLLAVRWGYKLNYSGTRDDMTNLKPSIQTSVEGISLGVGTKVTYTGYTFRLDYAFTQMDLVSNVHRISLHFEM